MVISLWRTDSRIVGLCRARAPLRLKGERAKAQLHPRAGSRGDSSLRRSVVRAPSDSKGGRVSRVCFHFYPRCRVEPPLRGRKTEPRPTSSPSLSPRCSAPLLRNRRAERHFTHSTVNTALSLLCLKTFSRHTTMLEAPPGSREDLVEAARTPCTPTDLDTMLYGYTNGIYVLDQTPESMPDMDMLKLFASPAGRALVAGENRPRGSTSTSSLSREFSSRLKSGRRPSGTVSAPTSPPRQRKTSDELYKDAVEILGLTCTLTDSCRCIDCQSSYFDFGDDDCGDNRTELAAGTPVLLDHALSNPLTCSIQ